jgi:enterobacteria phage integrase
MAPRQRKDPKLPDHMRERDGYYSWTSPLDGVEYGLGRDRRAAFLQAIEANAHLATSKPTLLQRIAGTARSWNDWCDEFEKLLSERDARPNTVSTRRSQMVRLRRSFSGPAAKVGTLEVSNVLKAIKAEGKNRTAQAFRSFLIDCFDRMIAQGWRTDNPARVTDKVRVKVKRARLPLTAFMTLYETTSVRWLRNAMALALVAGKDRHSVRNAQFADFRDGGWWNERSKTEARVFLPLELRLQCFGMSLDDVLRQCRATGVVSRYLVHQTERAKGATLGRPLHPDMITRKFSAELAKLKLDWGDKEPPTFHEIRSLAARLYKAQGDINPQDLLSHKDPRSTATYTDGRGEWVTLRVPK